MSRVAVTAGWCLLAAGQVLLWAGSRLIAAASRCIPVAPRESCAVCGAAGPLRVREVPFWLCPACGSHPEATAPRAEGVQ